MFHIVKVENVGMTPGKGPEIMPFNVERDGRHIGMESPSCWNLSTLVHLTSP